MNKIGMGELIVILIIAIVVLGPDKIPQVSRALGKAVRSVKKYVGEATKELEDIEELKTIKDDVDGIQKDLKTMGRSLEKSVTDEAAKVEEQVQKAEDELKSMGKDLKTAVEEEPEEIRPEEAAGDMPQTNKEMPAGEPMNADEAQLNTQEDIENE